MRARVSRLVARELSAVAPYALNGEYMNYYARHIGDYAKDAGHLTMIEDGAYQRLLDAYYSAEEALPDIGIERLCRARTPKESKVLRSVLTEFFELREGKWHKKRCDEEIAEYRVKAEIARNNGKKGGRPKITHPVSTENPPETQRVNSGNPEITQRQPIPSSQEPVASIGFKETNTPPTPHGGENEADFALAWEALDRWYNVATEGRLHLHNVHNEAAPVRKMLNALADIPPIPHNGEAVRAILLIPLAVDTKIQERAEFKNTSYACGCIKSCLNEWSKGLGNGNRKNTGGNSTGQAGAGGGAPEARRRADADRDYDQPKHPLKILNADCGG